MQIKSVMSSPIETVRGDQPIAEAAKLMQRKNIGSLLVINEDESGMITERDIVNAVADGLEDMSVSDYQQRPLITIEATESLSMAAQIMLDKKIRRLIVVDSMDKISGIVNIRDVLNAIQEKFIELIDD